jgi:hypothetical protein
MENVRQTDCLSIVFAHVDLSNVRDPQCHLVFAGVIYQLSRNRSPVCA